MPGQTLGWGERLHKRKNFLRLYKRNRVKRSIRELFRTHKKPGPPWFDIVVNARKPAARASYAVLRQDYLKVLGGIEKRGAKG